jgi:threonine dehydratase
MNDGLVSLSEIREARERIGKIAYRTPLYLSSALSALTHANVYLKLESYQPIRVFKVRGATNKILKLTADQRGRGLVAASSGNHGLAVAYLAKLTGTKATIVVPTSAVEEKVNAIEEYGAKVIKHGLFHDERFAKAVEIHESTGAVMIPPFDDPDIIAGQGTIGLEICEDLRNVSTVIVPIGGGGLISGISTAVKSLKSEAKVFGVEPEKASSMYQSMKNGKITRLSDTVSIADGLAAREPGVLTFAHVKKYVDEILLVSEEQIEKAVYTVLKDCHLLIEPSAAAAVAALLEGLHPKRGDEVVVVISGGNISLKILSRVLSKYASG